jgi:hypothetical protein
MGRAACMAERESAYIVLEGKSERKRPFGRSGHRSKNCIKVSLIEIVWKGVG